MVKTKLITVNTGALMSYIKPLDAQINEFLASNDHQRRLLMKKKFERFMTGFCRAGAILISFLMALLSFILMCKVEHKALVIAMYTCGIANTYLLCKGIYQLGEDLCRKKEELDGPDKTTD